jgi:hypothetical protein
VSLTGRLRLNVEDAPPVWVCGRAGGATGYLESLVSGIRVADEVLAVMGGDSGGDRSRSPRETR